MKNEKATGKRRSRTFLTAMDLYLFGKGRHYEVYNKLGAHACVKNGQKGVHFALWAPNAKSVRVIGDFNGWNTECEPMEKISDMGLFETFIPGAVHGQLYKYYIETPFGKYLYKADPYAFWCQLRPGTASRIFAEKKYLWTDDEWMNARKTSVPDNTALSIYEVHPGSWRKDYISGRDDGFYDYVRFAHELTDYVNEMGYTHVELMGIAEHPLDASWGYQVTGYYAPTARYGSPDEFKYLVNYLHTHGIGVILDWVPAHFPKDEFGLADFDGLAVYEHQDPRQGEHPDWGTKIFNYGRPQVSNFLIANALFWIEKYHVDGLRVDAVASMLYLDYGRGDNWVANKYGGKENLEAIEMLKHLNSVMAERNPGAMMIAEDSTAWPKVTDDPKYDGLGFTYKWNMGWMHDFTDYLKLDAYFRKYHHNEMTFAMTYAYFENYILVLSHDEVVHLKKSMFEKYPGDDTARFANLKTAYTFMMGHPGKKLLFMGGEFGQRREWSETRALDWELLEDERNFMLREYVKSLLHIYRENPAVYMRDKNPLTFEWVNADDAGRSIFSFIRWSPDGEGNLLFVCNFTPVDRPDYCVGVPRAGKYKLLLASEGKEFGGSGKIAKTLKAVKEECDHRPYRITFPLKGFESVIFKF